MNDQNLEYRGFTGSVKISLFDNFLHGKILGIEDLVTYEGRTVLEIKYAFKEAVADYMNTCEDLKRSPK